MKIRIIGPCGSGKTFAAKKIAEKLEIPFYETDNIIWDRIAAQKCSLEKRNERLNNILCLEKWIIEGAQYKWSSETFLAADLIVIFHPHPIVRDFRVIKRFIEMRLLLKQYNYTQSWIELLEMFKQNREYDRRTYKAIVSVTETYYEKRIIVKNIKEIFKYLENIRTTHNRALPI